MCHLLLHPALQEEEGIPGFSTTVPGCIGHPAGLANATPVPPVWAVCELVQCSFIHFLSLVFFLYLSVPAALLPCPPRAVTFIPGFQDSLELFLLGLCSLGTSQILNFPVRSLCQVHTVVLAQLVSGVAPPPLHSSVGRKQGVTNDVPPLL